MFILTGIICSIEFIIIMVILFHYCLELKKNTNIYRKRILDLTAELKLESQDKYNLETRSFWESAVLLRFYNITKDYLKVLNNNGNNKFKQERVIVKQLEEELNNIDIVFELKKISDRESWNIKKEINQMINDIISTSKSDTKIIVTIDSLIESNLVYDNNKLMTALKLLILKSIENDSKYLKISVQVLQKIVTRMRLNIVVENIKFAYEDYDIKNIINLLTLNNEDAYNTSFDKYTEFFIIKQYLKCISNSINVVQSNNDYDESYCMYIEMDVTL